MYRSILSLLVLLAGAFAALTNLDYGLGEIGVTDNYHSEEFDVVIFVNDDYVNLGDKFTDIEDALVRYNGLDSLTPKTLQIVPFMAHSSKRLLFAPTGNLNRDASDSRQIYDAARDAAKLAYSLKLRKPVFVRGPMKTVPTANEEKEQWQNENYMYLQMTLGALQGYYMPLILREDPNYATKTKFDKMTIYGVPAEFATIAQGIERGRVVNRDTCASDPERMPPPKVAEYYNKYFDVNKTIQIEEFTADEALWPVCYAVNRAVRSVDKYGMRIIKMQYDGAEANDADPTLVFVGKGICYDTGGSELKVSGNMKFMRKDKCGATSIAGFMKVLEELKPQHLRARAHLAFVRNGIGSDSYVFDEVVTTSQGVRVRMTSPDAEGRNVMLDMLTDAVKEHDDKKYVNPFFFTIATLTGAVGRNFKHNTAMLDNGPARKENVTKSMVVAGDNIAEVVEPMTLRKEDYDVNRPQTEMEDILQFNTKPRTSTYRGVQLPAGFMATASKLDEWGLQTREKKIPYTHLDVSAAVGVKYIEATGTPTSLFVSRYVLPRLKSTYNIDFPEAQVTTN
uniref:CYTOSOL_AP domain-containing protein n=1 Tax=Mesocestoides corti TaxID=53468 RepID=A0A5K3ERH9_MESCO